MADLHGRFRRLDRVRTPDLWNEAVARSAELELAPRRTFNPGMALIAVSLLLAALAGTVAVGAWLERQPSIPDLVTYENGMMVANDGCGRLIAIDPTSFEPRELVPPPAACTRGDDSAFWMDRPAWSSDGRRLAYLVSLPCDGCTEPPTATRQVWIYDAPTGETRQLDECADWSCNEIDISADGSLVAYVAGSVGEENASLVVTEVESGETHRIALAGQPGRPVFSPDGRRIALPLLYGKSGIYMVDVARAADGVLGEPTLVHGIVEASNLEWSPNGEWIAFRQSGGLRRYGVPSGDSEQSATQIDHAGSGIVVVRSDGTGARLLASVPEIPTFATWAPDSSSIAYVDAIESAAGTWELELWTVALDGASVKVYDSGCCKSEFAQPAWSPDGEWILFGVDLENRPSESGLFLVRPDGSDLRLVSSTLYEPAWQPIPQD
jgi:Tol biopolymer transport system component